MKNVIQPSLFVIAVVLNSVSVLAVQNDPLEQVLELPECDIYLFDVVEEKNLISIVNGRNVTQRAGYDNQPWFTPNGKTFLFTANYQPDRTDVYEFDLATAEIRQLTEVSDDAIIIASYGTFSTGINIKNLHNVIFASPSKSRVRNLQSIGRVLRKGENKSQATLYDIADDISTDRGNNYTLNHLLERVKVYNEEKFNYEIIDVKLKAYD